MTPTVLDHVVVALLAVASPVLGALLFRRMKARLAAGVPDVRVRQYRWTIALQLFTAGAVAAVWLSSRPVAGLVTFPLAGPGWVTPAGWVVAAVACALLILQGAALRGNEDGLARVRNQLEPVEAFLPHNRRELRLFYGVSFAAGTCEELVYRGFLMVYLFALGGALLAIPGSALLFGMAHAYQGPAGMARTGAVGLVLGGLYAATGNLLAPMVLHTVVDVVTGTLAYWAIGAAPAAGAVGEEVSSV